MVPTKQSIDVIGAYTAALGVIREKLQAGKLQYGDTVDLDEIMPGLTRDEQDRICQEQFSVYVGAAQPENRIYYKYNFKWYPSIRRLVIYTPALPD